MSDTDDDQSLKDILVEAIEKKGFVSTFQTTKPSPCFTEKLLDGIISEKVVRDELNNSRTRKSYGSMDLLVDFCMGRGRKLFCMIVLAWPDSKIVPPLKFLMEHKYEDKKLSAQIRKDGSCPWFTDAKLLDPVWKKFAKSRILELQWQFLIPVFSTEEEDYTFAQDVVLPFVKLETGGKVLGGTFSTVHKIRIPPGHFIDKNSNGNEETRVFALKEIRPPPEEVERIDDSWSNEVGVMKKMNSPEKGDQIVRCLSAFTRGTAPEKQYFLILEWANGGSLEDLFNQHQRPVLSENLAKQTITQLHSLSEALRATHGRKIRHGDLKPGNILRFDPCDDNIIGTLKIGDWGLAKLHSTATSMRDEQGLHTTTKYGTALYEAPEVELGEVKLLGRQYDVWSMGILALEVTIWLLYGRNGVHKFRKDAQVGHGGRSPGYEYTTRQGRHTAKVLPVIDQWMGHLSKDPRCSPESALGALLGLVKGRLLVVELSTERGNTKYIRDTAWEASDRRAQLRGPSTPTIAVTQAPPTPGLLVTRATNNAEDKAPRPTQRYRATSEELVIKLEEEVLDDEDRAQDYWLPAGEGLPVPNFIQNYRHQPDGRLNSTPRSMLTSQDTTYPSSSLSRLSVQDRQLLDSEWNIHDDSHFALKVLSRIDGLGPSALPELRAPATLCDTCQELDFFRTLGFSVEYDFFDLELRSKQCDLCALFWNTAQRQPGATPASIRFDRVQSYLVMNNAGLPVLSLYQDNGRDMATSGKFQPGLPRLPKPGSSAQFEILKEWLRECDESPHHSSCKAPVITSERMPTRLIDVGKDGDEVVHLWEPGRADSAEYLALSHPWGREPHFVSNISNVESHKGGISMKDLPATFRDAILITRALGKQHLWIDSICIIQGPGGDFEAEAARMETVFSSAYCVLAASRAYNQVDGFLGPYQDRDYVTMLNGPRRQQFYICENIDAFDAHVLGGHLHKRGWVLQEHALARRTVFFTEHQMYWECGDGVRCETLGKMSNNLAAFLGDPNFPNIIMSASQGEKIIRFQNLYKTYSSLGFTQPQDRPIAMDGIQSRLLKAFGSRGGYGILDEDIKTGQRGLLRRSLLWYRPHDMDLKPIDFPHGKDSVPPPSWSWMAYTGDIDFLELNFGKIEWKEVQSPWSGDKGATAPIIDTDNRWALLGKARTIIGGAKAAALSGRLSYDVSESSQQDDIRCVVLGVEHGGQNVDSRQHYCMLVAPAEWRPLGTAQTYKRIGAGYMLGKHVDKKGLEIRII
ncbi:hypothetical protein GGR57DRAFT_516783 [Xylariaceae sp. FL1272]|nr:hypothetical protein GGR57DRAFT_516783 [Xylariaceae sp. FL1272]